MKIDLAANREFVRGATAVLRKEDGSFQLKRLTKAMYDVFQTDPPSAFWDYMIDCAAGIRIEFVTEASELRMKTVYSKPLDKPLYVGETDVAVDGGRFRTFRAKPLTDQEEDNLHEFICPLGDAGTEKTVSIYLGNQVPSRILELEIDTDKMPHTIAYAQSI